ncbi:hypothetical protein T12_14957, partial [Trichinella patagoniensis]
LCSNSSLYFCIRLKKHRMPCETNNTDESGKINGDIGEQTPTTPVRLRRNGNNSTADSHEVIRRGLATLAETDLEENMTGESAKLMSTGNELLVALRKMKNMQLAFVVIRNIFQKKFHLNTTKQSNFAWHCRRLAPKEHFALILLCKASKIKKLDSQIDHLNDYMAKVERRNSELTGRLQSFLQSQKEERDKRRASFYQLYLHIYRQQESEAAQIEFNNQVRAMLMRCQQARGGPPIDTSGYGNGAFFS